MFEENKELLVVKPKFLFMPAFLCRIPITIFITIWSAGFFGGFSFAGIMGLKQVLGYQIVPTWLPFVTFGVLAFLTSQFFSLFWEQKFYEKTKYVFYPDELVYYEGYWDIQEKSINYKNILEISLRKGVFQQMYNLGTIQINTAAGSSNSTTGIRIKDIENPDEVYKFFKNMLNQKKNQPA